MNNSGISVCDWGINSPKLQRFRKLYEEECSSIENWIPRLIAFLRPFFREYFSIKVNGIELELRTLLLIFPVARHLLYVDSNYKPDLFRICLHMVFVFIGFLNLNTPHFYLRFDVVTLIARKTLEQYKSHWVIHII